MKEKSLKDLLLMAKGNRSLNAYARQADVSAGNLSRIINGQKPTPDILRRLAEKAHNGVTYEQLMIAAGYVDPNKFEDSQRVFSEFFEPVKTVKVPLLGNIPAGNPVEAIENVETWISVPEEYVRNGDYFYLRVHGDSMIGSRICDGDLVLVRRQPDVENGEIAVVRVNSHDATLKRVKRVNGHVILYPDNPSYEPIIVKEDGAEIIGKVVKVEFEPRKK